MANQVIALIAFFILSFFYLPTANARECFPHTAVAAMLAAEHKEHLAHQAGSSNGKLLEVYTRHDGKTWTMVVVHQTWCAEIVAAGEHWLDVPRPATDS